MIVFVIRCMGENKMNNINENKVLGVLCRKGHEYEDTGMSLRYKKGGRCVICKRINAKKFDSTHKESIAKAKHEYYITHKEARRESMHQYYINTYRDRHGMRAMADNKQCAQYLGVAVAEKILSEIYNNVTKMPYGHRGYDFICNKGKKIDVKSACVNKKGRWEFTIKRNTIAEFFLCLAFDNRTNLTPIHIWLIPGIDVNDKSGISIKPMVTDKWEKYELDISKVVNYCDNKKGADI